MFLYQLLILFVITQDGPESNPYWNIKNIVLQAAIEANILL